MSEILEVIIPATYASQPTLLVRCACGRTYRTSVHKAQARRMTHCMRCRPVSEPSPHAARKGRRFFAKYGRPKPLSRNRIGFT